MIREGAMISNQAYMNMTKENEEARTFLASLSAAYAVATSAGERARLTRRGNECKTTLAENEVEMQAFEAAWERVPEAAHVQKLKDAIKNEYATLRASQGKAAEEIAADPAHAMAWYGMQLYKYAFASNLLLKFVMDALSCAAADTADAKAAHHEAYKKARESKSPDDFVALISATTVQQFEDAFKAFKSECLRRLVDETGGGQSTSAMHRQTHLWDLEVYKEYCSVGYCSRLDFTCQVEWVKDIKNEEAMIEQAIAANKAVRGEA